MKNLLLFLNNKYEKIMILNHQKNIFKFLRRIKYDFYKSTKIIENLNFLDLRIKDLFSKDISKLYSENSRNLNKENIDYFCNNLKKYKGGEELYNILVNKTVEEMLICYANGDYINEGFYLEVDLNKIKEKNIKKEGVNIEKYIEKLRNMVKNFRNIFLNKSVRKKL